MKLTKAWYILTHWERWHYHAKYIPLYPAWAWYCLRARSFWWFTPSNPSITFGGFEGESKKEMYLQLPANCYPKSIYISSSVGYCKAEKTFIENNFTYPFAVKPDVGMMGFMFRIIENRDQFEKYHNTINGIYIVQHLVRYPLEVSVFYYRIPGQLKGHITGFLKKEVLHVEGDGASTLWELIRRHPIARFRLQEMTLRHKPFLGEVISQGGVFYLSRACNLSRGGKLISLEHEKTDSLLRVFDNLSHYTNNFYYGRYDIKCDSISDLQQGKNFSILEYNGCGAEPHHIYGNGNTLLQAYCIILHHWKILYRISTANHRKGVEYWGYRKGIRFLIKAKKYFKELKKMDAAFSL